MFGNKSALRLHPAAFRPAGAECQSGLTEGLGKGGIGSGKISLKCSNAERSNSRPMLKPDTVFPVHEIVNAHVIMGRLGKFTATTDVLMWSTHSAK